MDANTTKVHCEIGRLKEQVQQKFNDIREALSIREKLLLRQIEVISQQQQSQGGGGGGGGVIRANKANNAEESLASVKFLVEQEQELLMAIRNFGRFQLDNMNLALQDVYLKNEDYIAPSDDHEVMYKCLEQQEIKCFEDEHDIGEEGEGDESPGESQAVVVDFSKNKSLIEYNAKNMNESIINITLQEAKELIRKAKMLRDVPKQPLNLEELNDGQESSIAEAISSLAANRLTTSVSASVSASNATSISSATKVSKPSDEVSTTSGTNATNKANAKKATRFKPKITINNCNGTINLRNISSLTINCNGSEEMINAEIPMHHGQHVGTQNPQAATADSSKAAKYRKAGRKSKSLQKVKNILTNTYQQQLGPTPPAKATIMIEAQSASDASNSTLYTTTTSNSSRSMSCQGLKKKLKYQLKKDKDEENPTDNDNEHIIATHKDAYDEDDNVVVTCDFYTRLLNEIKESLKEKSKRTIDDDNVHYMRKPAAGPAAAAGTSDIDNSESNSLNHDDDDDDEDDKAADHYNDTEQSDSNNPTNEPSASTRTTTTTSGARTSDSNGRHLVLKNFENLKIVLEANSDEETFHPVQIEQWLAEIISETDLEPMQNTEILEHSKIHNNTD